MSTSAWRVNSGTVALASAMRRAMTCWVRVSSCTRTSPLAVATSAGAAAGAGSAGAAGRLRWSGGGRRTGRGGGLHVGLHDPPARAAAVHGGEVDAVLAGDPAGDGRGLRPLAARPPPRARTRSARPASRGWARPASSRWRRRARRPARRRACRAPRPRPVVRLRRRRGRGIAAVRAAALADAGDHLADRQRGALGGDDLEHAVLVGLVGHGRLVGLDLDQLLAARTSSPSALSQLQDRALLHGVRQAGHDDVGHDPSLQPAAARAAAVSAAAAVPLGCRQRELNTLPPPAFGSTQMAAAVMLDDLACRSRVRCPVPRVAVAVGAGAGTS